MIALTVGPSNAKSVSAFERRLEPVTLGVPFPREALVCPDRISVHGIDGSALPTQARTLDTWADGSIRWALVDFQADVLGVHDSRFEVRLDGSKPGGSRAIDITQHHDTIRVHTGAATFVVPRSGVSLFRTVTIDGTSAIETNQARLQTETADGSIECLQIADATIEERGPLRTVVRIDGAIGGHTGRHSLDVIARLHFFAGWSTVRFDVTVKNARPAHHPGGYWDLGSEGSVFLKDLAFTLGFPNDGQGAQIECSPEAGFPFEVVSGSLELYQDSSGGRNWRSTNHVNRHGEMPIRFQGYRLRSGRVERTGLRATPIVSVTRRECRVTVSMPEFWQNFPKAIEATSASITVRLFPRQWADVHEIQGGEQKTHTFFANFGCGDVTPLPLVWSREPLLARAAPRAYCSSGVVPHLIPAADDPHADYLRLVNAAIEGNDTFETKRETIDEYGWRNFGDAYADHEAVRHDASTPLVSHFNNQYDAVAGFACQFLRTGDVRWWHQMDELARHVVDIDIYHTDRDKAAYNRGLFWHTAHYLDADTSTHRCYPQSAKAAGVPGGGPSAEHNYTGGLMLHYFLTGNPQSREAAIGLAHFVVNIDDGRKTPFRWLARGRTGLATASGSFLYHGPGRAAGNSLKALLDGHRLTGDNALLQKAEEIIRRVIHPADDIAALDLLDAERRWFYTIFLQALGKYLEYKSERDEHDDGYRYAREALLHYARWMAVNEYPYLDKPEILEYPTETWAAQDMRKSEVFDVAAMHVTGDERERFLERAAFFFRASTTTLLSTESRTLARPVVLMLSNGFARAFFASRPHGERPDVHTDQRDFGRPMPFIAQKTRAKRACVRLAAAAGVAGLIGIALAFAG